MDPRRLCGALTTSPDTRTGTRLEYVGIPPICPKLGLELPPNRTDPRHRARTLLDQAAAVRRAFPRGAMGLETAALQALLHVWLTPGSGARETAAALKLDRSTASHALRALAEAELVAGDAASSSDGRRRGYRTTAAGEAIVTAFLRDPAG
jgi:DNA-binding MarR family transcriptional regulator